MSPQSTQAWLHRFLSCVFCFNHQIKMFIMHNDSYLSSCLSNRYKWFSQLKRRLFLFFAKMFASLPLYPNTLHKFQLALVLVKDKGIAQLQNLFLQNTEISWMQDEIYHFLEHHATADKFHFEEQLIWKFSTYLEACRWTLYNPLYWQIIFYQVEQSKYYSKLYNQVLKQFWRLPPNTK